MKERGKKMKQKIVGIETITGEYQGRSYSNCYLYFEKPYKEGCNFIGSVYGNVKVKFSVLDDICKRQNLSIQDVLGLYIVDVYYNKYGQVNMIVFGNK